MKEQPNRAPLLSDPGPQSSIVGTRINLQLGVTDADDDTLTFAVSGLPDGLSIYPPTGLISGTFTTVQTTTVTITVTDGRGGSDSVSFIWGVEESPNRAPILTELGPQINTVGMHINLQLGVSDADDNTLTFSASGLPDGIGMTPMGLISGTLTTIQTTVATITVMDGRGGSDSVSFTWTVNERPNRPPLLDNPGPQTNHVDARMSLQVGVSNADGDSLTFAASGLPDGLSIDPDSGLISGTFATVQTAAVTVTVVDDRGGSDSASFTWTVNETPNRPPLLDNPGPQTNAVGTRINLQIGVIDADDDTLNFSASGLPNGLDIDFATGLISGTFTTMQTTIVTVAVADGYGGSDDVSFTWTVNDQPNRAPLLTNPGLQINSVGTQINLQPGITDADDDTLNFSASGLPDGLNIDSITGLISGMLTAIQTTAVTVTVADGNGGTDDVSFTWIIHDGSNQPPLLTDPGPQSHSVGTRINLQLGATDVDDDPLTFSVTGLPDGLHLNPTAGLISGTFTAAQITAVTVTVLDGNGGVGSAFFPWTVQMRDNRPPQLKNPGPQIHSLGTSINLQLGVADIDDDILLFDANGLPDGLRIDPTTGQISGTVTTALTTTVTITVADGNGGSDSATFAWTITEAISGINPATPNGGLGDVNCDGKINTVDANTIMQYEVGLISDNGQCPSTESTVQIHAAEGNINYDFSTNVIDALLIMQCEAEITNTFCPETANGSGNRIDPDRRPNAVSITGTARISITNEGSTITIWADGRDGAIAAGTVVITYDRTQSILAKCTALENGFCHEANPGVVIANFVNVEGLRDIHAIGQLTFRVVDGAEGKVSSYNFGVPTLVDQGGAPLNYVILSNPNVESNIELNVEQPEPSPTGYELFIPVID